MINYVNSENFINQIYKIASRNHPMALRSGLTLIITLIKVVKPQFSNK